MLQKHGKVADFRRSDSSFRCSPFHPSALALGVRLGVSAPNAYGTGLQKCESKGKALQADRCGQPIFVCSAYGLENLAVEIPYRRKRKTAVYWPLSKHIVERSAAAARYRARSIGFRFRSSSSEAGSEEGYAAPPRNEIRSCGTTLAQAEVIELAPSLCRHRFVASGSELVSIDRRSSGGPDICAENVGSDPCYRGSRGYGYCASDNQSRVRHFRICDLFGFGGERSGSDYTESLGSDRPAFATGLAQGRRTAPVYEGYGDQAWRTLVNALCVALAGAYRDTAQRRSICREAGIRRPRWRSSDLAHPGQQNEAIEGAQTRCRLRVHRAIVSSSRGFGKTCDSDHAFTNISVHWGGQLAEAYQRFDAFETISRGWLYWTPCPTRLARILFYDHERTRFSRRSRSRSADHRSNAGACSGGRRTHLQPFLLPATSSRDCAAMGRYAVRRNAATGNASAFPSKTARAGGRA